MNRKNKYSILNALTGVAGIRHLFGNSRRIFSDGVNDVYVKKGGFNDAIKDFYALNPSDVKHIVKYELDRYVIQVTCSTTQEYLIPVLDGNRNERAYEKRVFITELRSLYHEMAQINCLSDR